jgi:hypothetical protein
VVGSDNVFESPGGRTVVWFECVIRRHVPDGDEEPVATLVLREASPFELEDGSGRRLRIVPGGGYLLPEALEMSPSIVKEPLLTRLREILVFHGKACPAGDELRIAESFLALGEEAVARGAVRAGKTPPYRESASMPAVMTSDGEDLYVWTPTR